MSDEITPEMFAEAAAHCKAVKNQYDSLVGMPGVNPIYGLLYINGYLTRYGNGERTVDLYESLRDSK